MGKIVRRIVIKAWNICAYFHISKLDGDMCLTSAQLQLRSATILSAIEPRGLNHAPNIVDTMIRLVEVYRDRLFVAAVPDVLLWLLNRKWKQMCQIILPHLVVC